MKTFRVLLFDGQTLTPDTVDAATLAEAAELAPDAVTIVDTEREEEAFTFAVAHFDELTAAAAAGA